MRSSLIIATRESLLALEQARSVQETLQTHYPNCDIRLLGITTTADQRLDITLNRIGGKGLFVKELEQALLREDADIAVHSMKDVPMELPHGLTLPIIMEREDPFDAFVSTSYESLAALPSGARVGTASLRRTIQLKRQRPDLDVLPLRGNINTRLNRLDQGDFDAIILAAAGLKRMGFHKRIRMLLEESLPAAGQGALGIECRSNDSALISALLPLHHADTARAVLAERALCRRLNGGCQVPIGAYATTTEEGIHLRAMVASIDGLQILEAEERGSDPEQVAEGVMLQLVAQGALGILSAFR